ncbi:MAG: hypothetical protein A4E64_02145 [Syntrophorhabdus sp. PtaU1.Bin058]|nr:MAG: hypothetical protein A4E64_02145 [Syntrophorhabdus sp. PtaU1.Bin058]
MDELIDNRILQAWGDATKDEKKDFVAVLLKDPELWLSFWDRSSGEARKKLVEMLVNTRCTLIEQMIIKHKKGDGQ